MSSTALSILAHGSTFLSEYALNKTQSTISVQSEPYIGAKIKNVHVQFGLYPLDRNCNLCGETNDSTLYDGEVNITTYPQNWIDLFPNSKGWNCREIDQVLTPISTLTEACKVGRASFFEESCCDDVVSTHDCESDIHDRIVQNLDENSISPPDPSPQEQDKDFSSKDAVDVKLSLDIIHILGIDIKANTMTMVIALELGWFDQRLQWEPFAGGCHRASFRASIDKELTEIWVPYITLVNHVDGVDELPEAHASVRQSVMMVLSNGDALVCSQPPVTFRAYSIFRTTTQHVLINLVVQGTRCIISSITKLHPTHLNTAHVSRAIHGIFKSTSLSPKKAILQGRSKHYLVSKMS